MERVTATAASFPMHACGGGDADLPEELVRVVVHPPSVSARVPSFPCTKKGWIRVRIACDVIGCRRYQLGLTMICGMGVILSRARIGTAKRLKQTKGRKKEKRKKGRRQTTKMTTTTITGARTRGKSKVDTRQEQGHGPLRGARRTDHPNESSPRSSSCPFPWCSARPTVGGRN